MSGARTVSVILVAASAIWLCVSAALESNWDQAARDHILDIHNQYRRDEGGCQINKLVYDMELEAESKRWAENCEFRHELQGRGENLAFSTFKHPENQLITDSAQQWFDEKKDYTFGQRECMKACHYTQLVWDTTQKVGCYSTRCPNLAGGARNAWYLVCFYDPKGNTNGQNPYQTTCDSPCRNGQTLEDGLCVGEVILPCEDGQANCEGWAKMGQCEKNAGYMAKHCRKACKLCEPDEEKSEEDAGSDKEGGETEGSTEEGGETGGSTEEGGETGGSTEEGGETDGSTEEGGETGGSTKEDGETGGSTEEGGEKEGSTEEGEKEGSTEEGGEKEGSTEEGEKEGNTEEGEKEGSTEEGEKEGSTEEGGETGESKDKDSQTGESKDKDTQKGEDADDGYQADQAADGGEGEEEQELCEDQHFMCPVWAKSGQCKANPGAMLVRCKKSCDDCGGQPTAAPEECKDDDPTCAEWAEHHHCRINPGYMLIHCKKSCNSC